MCGIAGLISHRPVDASQLRGMTDPIAHRGPDDEGMWIDDEAHVGLGFRRLSIIELSPAGHQPMHSKDGRYVVSFNGEIYNHAAIRRELEGLHGTRAWLGHSDTETLVEAICTWGLRAAIERCVGMFAIAVWDKRARWLHLIRDRFGEKPLYYGWVGGDFVYGSELKSFRAHRRFNNPVDRQSLGLLASRNYIPAPHSIFEGIFKLEPGCILSIDPAGARLPLTRAPEPDGPLGTCIIERYWRYRDVVAAGLRDPITDEADALDHLDRVLGEAIAGQAVADVPVGAFLSGGVDSSMVVALYQKHAPGPVRTFSLGFAQAGFDEAGYARAVAAHFGTEHNERYVTVAETQNVIPLLPAMYDEPFADSSQIPTHLVSRFAREQVTVALSGDGGDELFGGYNRYLSAAKVWRLLDRLPASVRSAIGRSLGALPPAAWNRLAGLLPGERPPHFGGKVQKGLRTVGSARNLQDVFTSFLDEWSGEPSPVIGVERAMAGGGFDLGSSAPDATRMMYCDAVTYLPDDILCKVDRAAMAVSLETRVPFLDHRVAALAARIPVSMNISGDTGKLMVRKLLYRQAPRALFERPKAGFAIPIGDWLRGPLRAWAEDLLDASRMKHEGFFDVERIQRRWTAHVSGTQDSTAALWAVLMFQAWHRTSPYQSPE
ncbi:MAG TPA: asparagine synthase (glutamine-hydrolyzing) [Sphingomonadaceae bacterium]|nr:asparagine synthase (glutamine-hydrolyzing) [Sphingomonadaceae bacterium]